MFCEFRSGFWILTIVYVIFLKDENDRCCSVMKFYLVHVKCQYHWVQSKCHRLWFSTKTCSCYSTKTYVDSVILILKLNVTSLRNIYIKMCVVLNEDHFLGICFSKKSNSIYGLLMS